MNQGKNGLTLLVVRNEGLGDGLSDGVYLGHVSSTIHSNSDVYVGKLLLEIHNKPLDIRLYFGKSVFRVGFTSDLKGLHITSQLDAHIRDKWNHHD